MSQRLPKLAIVGASARAAACSALRAGFDVVAADLFADADLARIASVTRMHDYPHGFVDWLAATDCDAWIYTGALENSPDLIDRMAAVRPLLGNCGEALRVARDPLRLQAAFAEAGVSFPETRATANNLPLDGSWLCKTYRGASGSGVWALDGPAALERACKDGAIFQRYISGDAAAAILSLRRCRATLLGVTRQRLSGDAEHRWHFVGSIGPLSVEPFVVRQLATVGEVLAAKFGLIGVVGVDFVLNADGATVIEVNPRYTASVEIVERCYGVCALAGVGDDVLAEVGDDPARSGTEWVRNASPGFFAKSIFFASRDATVSPRFFDWAIERSSIDLQRCQLADIPAAGEVIPAERPVLTVFADGPSPEECEQALRERLAEVESRLYDS